MKAYLSIQLFWTYFVVIQSSILKCRKRICRQHLSPLPKTKIWFQNKFNKTKKKKKKKGGKHATVKNMPWVHERITHYVKILQEYNTL